MSRSLVKFRTKLWKANPHCENCGVLTILPEYVEGKNSPSNMATIQHVHHKFHPDRGVRSSDGTRKNQLWCSKCNNEDGHKQYHIWASTEEQRKLSQNGHKKLPQFQIESRVDKPTDIL